MLCGYDLKYFNYSISKRTPFEDTTFLNLSKFSTGTFITWKKYVGQHVPAFW